MLHNTHTHVVAKVTAALHKRNTNSLVGVVKPRPLVDEVALPVVVHGLELPCCVDGGWCN